MNTEFQNSTVFEIAKGKKLDASRMERFFSINEKRAIEKYVLNLQEEIKDKFEFEKQVIRDAKQGNKTAIKYVFYELRENITKTFFSSFLGEINRSEKIKDDIFDEWVNIAYEVLTTGDQEYKVIDKEGNERERISTLEYFNVDKFEKRNNKVTPFSSLGHFYWRFLSNTAIRHNLKKMKHEYMNMEYTDNILRNHNSIRMKPIQKNRNRKIKLVYPSFPRKETRGVKPGTKRGPYKKKTIGAMTIPMPITITKNPIETRGVKKGTKRGPYKKNTFKHEDIMLHSMPFQTYLDRDL
jgi:hypothetical protein